MKNMFKVVFVAAFAMVSLFSCYEKKSMEMRELTIYDSVSVSIDYPILTD